MIIFSIIDEIFSKVDHHIEQGDLIQEFNMSNLPSLYDNFVQLIEYLVNFFIIILLILLPLRIEVGWGLIALKSCRKKISWMTRIK